MTYGAHRGRGNEQGHHAAPRHQAYRTASTDERATEKRRRLANVPYLLTFSSRRSIRRQDIVEESQGLCDVHTTVVHIPIQCYEESITLQILFLKLRHNSADFVDRHTHGYPAQQRPMSAAS